MPPSDKPRHHSGYQREETVLVEAACLTVAVTLGAMMDRLCIVGGLAPSLLIDRQADADPTGENGHAGTNDLDVGLAVALLDEQQYSEIARRLRQEDFEPDVNAQGNPTPQRWRLGELNVTIDFLMPPIPGAEQGGRVQPLEGDFGALIAPGLELAFLERELIPIDGHTLRGEHVSRIIPVCGPGALIVLKALALADRGEPRTPTTSSTCCATGHTASPTSPTVSPATRPSTASWSSAHSSYSPATSPNPTVSAPAAQRNSRAPETSTPRRQPMPTGTSTTSCVLVASAGCPSSAVHRSIETRASL